VLLAGLVIIAALGLAVASREVASAPGPIGGVPELVLDPNTTPPRVLAALPHVGPVLANRLVEARTERPFSSLEDIQARVRGIGPVTLARIAPYLRRIESVSGPVPENLASTGGGTVAGKPKASRRKTIRRAMSNPKPAQVRIVANDGASQPNTVISPAR
jgi:hypothetical protein